ncbi:hypothetical protein DM02DRAFT_708092 [Periconia macrospinosa]|uniref:Uncharacterized protein n=1 Tax=Periconia macrospinosa TaxID=97972 RepID=A0A2V1DR32_9PLEO|nr:hypothetical protein DM02DRAFT_708092 [Periconia macrospinosa]
MAMKYAQFLALAGLAAANDALLQNPSITSTITTASDGSLHTIIPMVMTDLVTLASTTTVTTTITVFTDNDLATPTHTIAVQPSGIWWRDGLVGPPVPIPSFALNPGLNSSSGLLPPVVNSKNPPSPSSSGNPPPPPPNTKNPSPPRNTGVPPPTPSSSSSPQTEPPSQPTLTMPPTVPNKFRIRIHQKVGGGASVEWTLLDSNSQNTIAGPDKTNTIPGSSEGDSRSEIRIEVMEPENKEKTRIVFTMKKDVGGGCMPTWDIAPSSGPETSFVRACKDDVASQYGCDDPKKVTWNTVAGGFERSFECWWLDVFRITVGLG